jgi:hypothetical protein
MSAEEQPIARRRTPRKSAPPSRLGLDDNWAKGPAGKWTPDRSVLKKEEDEKVAKREDRIKKEEAAEVAEAKPSLMAGGYTAIREKLPVISSFGEAAVLALLGDAVSQLVVLKMEFSLDRAAQFALWGALVSLLVGPFQKWVRGRTFSAVQLIDTSAKAVLGQITISPLLTALFIFYLQICKVGFGAVDWAAYVAELQAGFGFRYKLAVGFWLAADCFNYALVPTRYCVLYTSAMAAVWGCLSSAFTI